MRVLIGQFSAAVLGVVAGAGFLGAAAPASGATLTDRDLALYGYRVQTEGGTLKVLADYEGASPVLGIEYAGGPDGSTTITVFLAARKLELFSPAIPPYIGLGARKFSARIWVPAPADLMSARVALERNETSDKAMRINLAELKAGQWNRIEFEDPELGSVQHPLAQVKLRFKTRAGATGKLYLADPVLTTQDGRQFPLISKEMPLLGAGMARPLAEKPERPLPSRDTLTMGGYLVDLPEWADQIPAMAKFMQERFPEVDLVLAPVFTPVPIVAQRLSELPQGVYFQFQKAPMDSRYLGLAGALPENGDGKQLTDFSNSVLATHPLMQKGLKDQVDYAASLGINHFMQVDYVWPYFGGRWGYDAASVAAYREDLLAKDEGLSLLPGPGGAAAGTIHFWDYYEQYHGFRLTPADIGISDWGQYKPVSEKQAADGDIEAKKNLGLYVTLYHYEWLRQAQRFGRWAKAYGGKHDFTLNPEDLGNAADYVYLTRLADAGIPYIEYFGSPGILHSAYATLPMYVRAGEIAGKKVGLITEIGQCGHGEHYLDPEVAYLYAYELGALGLQNYHNEWMEAPFDVMSDPKNAYHYDRFSEWMSQAYGFRQARREHASRPAPKVMSVSLRSTVFYMNNWISSLEQMDSLSPMLADAYVDFEQTDPVSLPDVLGNTQTLFYTPPASSRSSGPRLRAWLDTGGRTLVTHSYIPVAEDDGQAQLAQGVENVLYKGEQYNYSNYLSVRGSAEYHLLAEFQGLKQDSDKRWKLAPAVAAKAQVLLGTVEQPLLSRIDLPKGSCILYLHMRPQDLPREAQLALAKAISAAVDLPRIAIEDATLGSPVMAHRFVQDQTLVVSLWNRAKLNELGFYAGYGPHLLPDRGQDQFDPKRRPYPYRTPGAACGARVSVGAPGTYRVYRFLEDSEQTVQVGADRLLPLTVKDVLVEQFYIAPDGDGIQQKIAALRKHRVEVKPFMPNW